MSELDHFLTVFSEDGHILPLRQILSEAKIRGREGNKLSIDQLAERLKVPRSTLFRFFQQYRSGGQSEVR
jgi:DNA-binding transcriptional regulator YiaG